jgi:hypothetical protein
MEILIVGILVVALMVWASTRIKRNAAAAFDAETIDTDEFTLQKPDGWLSKVEPTLPYVFEAYTKDFAEEPNQGVRLGTAVIEKGIGSEDEIARVAIGEGVVTDDLPEIVGAKHYRIIELTRSSDEIDELEWLKFATTNGTVYTLRVTALAETTDEFRRNIESMVDSFEIK